MSKRKGQARRRRRVMNAMTLTDPIRIEKRLSNRLAGYWYFEPGRKKRVDRKARKQLKAWHDNLPVACSCELYDCEHANIGSSTGTYRRRGTPYSKWRLRFRR